MNVSNIKHHYEKDIFNIIHDQYKNYHGVKEILLITDKTHSIISEALFSISLEKVNIKAIYTEEMGDNVSGKISTYFLGKNNQIKIPGMLIDNTGFYLYDQAGKNEQWSSSGSDPVIYNRLRSISKVFMSLVEVKK